MTTGAEPEYQRLMRLIRSRIIDGEYPIGSPVPSTTELVAQSGMSRPVVRRAIDQLKAEGILEGHQGKGVFVAAMPADADHRRADTEALAEQFAELRQELRELEKTADLPEVLARLGKLETRVGRMEAIMVNFASRSGFPNPFGSKHDDAERPARRGRAG